MEQFVLGIFQEQLSKFIVGFRKEQVNANLLNGKGEIRDVELNCDFLNQSLSIITPLIELQSVKVSKLSFHVTSWTNIRKAPILVDIEHVTATLVEPLTFVDARNGGGAGNSSAPGGTRRRRRMRQITQQQLLELIQRGAIKSKSSNAPYSLLDRIIDNLTVEVASVNVTFQPRGRFKTTRRGPWTPPAIHLSLADLTVVSVNEFGHEAPPAEIWKHNHQHHHHNQSTGASSSSSTKGCFLIYKKISTEYRISLRPHHKRRTSTHTASNTVDDTVDDIPLIAGRNNKVCLHVAMKRRVRDSEWMAVQLDASIPKVEIDIPQHALPVLAHALAGIQYCLAKDRAFEDPLNDDAHDSSHSSSDENGPHRIVTHVSDGASFDNDGDDDEGGIIPEDTIDESSASSASSSDDAETEIPLAHATTVLAPQKSSSSLSNPTSGSASKTSTPRPSTLSAARYSLPASTQNQPVLVLPTGLLIHEKLSISFCIQHASVRGTYASTKNNGIPTANSPRAGSSTPTPQVGDSTCTAAAFPKNGHFLIVSKGFVAEAIWPKTTKEKGGYVQASVSYLAIKETYGERVVTLVAGGVEQYEKSRPLEQSAQPLPSVKRDETFPLFEDRVVRPDPMGVRHSFPAQAFGVKTTIDFVKKLSKSDGATKGSNVAKNGVNGDGGDDSDEDIRVLHEVGIDRFDIAADSVSWGRILQFSVNEHGGGYDPRWHSGNWSDCISPDMLLNPSGGRSLLNLDECLQPTKQLLLDENAFISSDLFNLTARVTNIDFRIPAAIHKDVKSCTVAIRLTEVMLLVSSALPRTLEEKGIIHFPNDPSDVAYTLERLEDPSIRQRGIMTTRAISTFRSQLTYRGVSVRLVPVIPFYVAKEPQQLLAPAELTMIVCFEGEPPESEASNLAKIVLFASVQVHRLEVNLDFDLLAAALVTLLHHADSVKRASRSVKDTLSRKSQQPDAGLTSDSDATAATTKDGKIKKTLRGRRVLVRKQMIRSRETGGLSLAVGLKVADLSLRLWRQFVPCTGPLRSCPPLPVEHNGVSPGFLPLVQVARLEVKGTELGVEATLRKQNRRVVVKGRFSEIEMKACDLAAMCTVPDSGIAMNQTHHDNNSQVTDDVVENDEKQTDHECFLATLLCLGKQHFAGTGDCEYAAAVRCEEHLQDERCWSVAADIARGGIINCRPEEIESFAVLVFEALLMPVMSNYQHENDMKLFPDGTIGWLLASITRALVGTASETPIPRREPAKESKSLYTPDDFSVKSIDTAIRNLIGKVVPNNVETILCHAQICDLLITVAPKPAIQSQITGPSFSLHLQSADFLAIHLPSRLGQVHQALFEVTACKGGETWSAIMVGDSREAGLRHRAATRMSLQTTTCTGSDSESPPLSALMDNDLVPPFEFSYSYGKSRASVSMSDTFVISNVEKLDDFLCCILDFAGRCKRVTNNMSNVVGVLRGSRKPSGKAVVEKTTEIHYVEKSCSRTAESLASVRGLLQKLNERLITQDHDMRNIVGDSNRKLESMRVMVFTKEKERAAALALVSSQATGWLQIGDSSRTGQRGELTSTLWSYWAVLRRGLLIIYQGPGQTNPLDVIPLHSASLRQLSGGQRKRDLKRAFALVQSSGMVRLFVVGSDNEYHKWIRELRRSTNSFSPSQEESIDSCGSGDHSLGDMDNLRPIEAEELSEPYTQGRSLGKGLSRAVQVARATKHAVVDRSIRRRKESDDVIATGIEDDTILPETHPGALLGSKPLDGSSHGGGRRQSILTGARQTTTMSRFGSALEIARQKGREVVEKRRQRPSAAADDDTKPQSSSTAALAPAHESTNLHWSCSTCTYVNLGTVTKCEMCESERPPLEGSSPTTSNIANEESSDVIGITSTKSTGETDDKEDVASFTGSMTGRVGMRQRLGAAVLNRLSTRDAVSEPGRSSGRLSLLRGSISLNDGSDHAGQEAAPPSLKLKNILVGDELTAPVPSFGDIDVELPLKRLAGRWFVRVDVARGSSEQDGVLPETVMKADENTQQECNTLSFSPANVGKAETETEALEKLKAPETVRQCDAFPSFDIHVFKCAESEARRKPTHSIARNLSEILTLHTELSESVSRILPTASPSSYSIEDCDRLGGDMKPSLAAALGLTALDAVRITGMLLGGLLGTQPCLPTSDAPMKFQVDVVAEFLNCMIDSVLPIDGLYLLADFLGITDVSTESAPSIEAQRRVILDGSTTTVSEESSHDIHSLMSICQGEILRAETHNSMLELQQAGKPFPVDKVVLSTEASAATAAATTTMPILSLGNASRSSSFVHANAKKSDRFQQAIHAALIKAMEERDEAHARLVAAEVLFAHELEQQKKKTDLLEAELAAVRIAAAADGKMDARRVQQEMQHRHAMNVMQQDSDDQLVQLCRQLSVEIGARTASALEVSRLQECRRLEREQEHEEKATLMQQIAQLQQELARERANNSTSRIADDDKHAASPSPLENASSN